MTETFPPTDEQAAIATAAALPDNLMVTAMAGTGKTSTLKLIAPLAAKGKPGLALAFNKKIAVELEKSFPSNWKVQTFNGLGHGAWSKAIGKRCGVNVDKIYETTKQVIANHGLKQADMGDGALATIMSYARTARTLGLVPKQFSHATGLTPDTGDGWLAVADFLYLDYDPRMVELAYDVLVQSIKLAYNGDIDYDDQIYMSALFGGVFPRFPVVMVDEAQDLSPLNHIQLRKVAVARIIACGDPRQAIYAFRGADAASMGTLRSVREAWLDFPLSLTFRCSRAVVARQQSHAPGFRAAPTNAEGAYEKWTSSESWPDGKEWTIAKVLALAAGRPMAILCRNNAPLFAAALRCLRAGHGVNLMGSELAKGLIALTKKLFADLTLPIAEAGPVVQEWIAGEISKARANGKEERVALIRDRGECLLAIIENADIKVVGGVIATLNSMFSKDNLRITLATGHKAKGLEWPVVVHLDPWRVPSKYALRAAEEGNTVALSQDLNLKYVIETRSSDILIDANLSTFEGGSSDEAEA